MTDHALREELEQMFREDQSARRAVDAAGGASDELWAQLAETDRRNTARMHEIVGEHGWPSRSLVGADAAHSAWALVQHATHDVPFMRRCLELMTGAVEQGEAAAADRACFYDRVLYHETGEQLYGTYYLINSDLEIAGARLIDPESVDERRRAVGLAPLEEHLARLRADQAAMRAAAARNVPESRHELGTETAQERT